MAKIRIMDPAGGKRDGWHNLTGSDYDAMNGNISRVFFTEVPFSVPTTDCRQPDGWSCGPYALAECLGQSSGEPARAWLQERGLISSEYGTWYSGIVGYINANGYECDYDGHNYDGEMSGAIYDKIVNHLSAGKKIIFCMHCARNTYWTGSGHYVMAYGIDGTGIEVDGLWGCGTTKKAQQVFGTTQDGTISNQNKMMKGHLPNCQSASWKFVDQSKLKRGSDLVRAIQKKLGVTVDGFFGMETIIAFQRFLNVSADGYVGGATVTAFQRWLNNQ